MLDCPFRTGHLLKIQHYVFLISHIFQYINPSLKKKQIFMFSKTITSIERNAKGENLVSSPPTQSQLNSYSYLHFSSTMVLRRLLVESFPKIRLILRPLDTNPPDAGTYSRDVNVCARQLEGSTIPPLRHLRV